MKWADFPQAVSSDGSTEVDLANIKPTYAVQLVRQVNYGPLESKRYFIPTDEACDSFREITEDHLVQANFQKLNSYFPHRSTFVQSWMLIEHQLQKLQMRWA